MSGQLKNYFLIIGGRTEWLCPSTIRLMSPSTEQAEEVVCEGFKLFKPLPSMQHYS